MPAPRGFISYSILDAKNKRSTTQISFPIDNMDSDHFDVLLDFAETTAELIDAIIRGQIVDVGIGVKVDLSGATLKGSPVASADVEEGARFQFRTVLDTLTGFRLPTFDEDFILAGTQVVDLEDTDVDAFVDRITGGRTVSLVNVSPSDDRGSDIVSIESARESFQSSRT